MGKRHMKHQKLIGVALLCGAAFVAGCSTKTPAEKSSASSGSSQVITLDDANFDAQVANGVVLVDFWATWCAPCKMQGPIVEEVATQVRGKAKVAKLDVDAARKIAQRFDIRGIPTLIVFRNGTPGRRFVGLTEAEKLVSAIEASLKAKD